MIPRFKPTISARDLTAAVGAGADPARFERAFASAFGASEAIAFNSGRGALFALCQALGLEGTEVVMPAYTCSVVAYAISVSGNTPVFVDAESHGYNMDLDRLEAAITPRTSMVIPTHLFGFPADVDRVRDIVNRASARYGHKIWIVQDCAHAFGARWNGTRVSEAGDIALFGLGISKMMTAIFGGILTTSDAALATRLRAWRERHSAEPSAVDEFAHGVYLLASTTAFSAPFYGFVRWLQDETSLLDGMTKAYHMDGLIRLPPDATARMATVDARVGLEQLQCYERFEARRREHARAYRETLTMPADWQLPADVDGATYSHFPVQVADREGTLRRFLGEGIQLGRLIEYSVPHLAEYGPASPQAFPNSWKYSQHTINLPVHPSLSDADRSRIIDRINGLSHAAPMAASHAH